MDRNAPWYDASLETGSGISILSLGMPDRTGVLSSTRVFQSALYLPDPGEVINVIVPSGTYRLDTSPVMGVGTVNWVFLPGVSLVGAGTLPFYQKTMTTDPSEPAFGHRRSIWHGVWTSPTYDGPAATDFVGRVDNTVRVEGPSSLLHVRMTALQRFAAGRGWIQANKTYVEDYSTSANSQTVGVASVMYVQGQGAGWGLYSETHGYGANCSPVSCELNVSNYTGADYNYNEAAPVTSPCSKGLWIVGFGAFKNTFAIGVAAGAYASKWGAGLYMAAGSITDYGIDIQAQPATLMRFKFGAAGGAGVGIDFGAGAAYGFANGQGAMNIWNHAIRFGPGGQGYIAFNATSGNLEIGYNGVVKRTIDMASAYKAL